MDAWFCVAVLQEPSTEDEDAENALITEDEQYSQLKAMLAKLPSFTEPGNEPRSPWSVPRRPPHTHFPSART